MTINIGLTKEQLKGSVTILNQLLADEFSLYLKTRNYHWNVTGKQFHDLHKFFQSLYEELDQVVDDIAERTRALDGLAIATLSEYSKLSTIKEETTSKLDSDTMIKNLLSDNEQIIRELRVYIVKTQDEFEDAGTADFLTGLMEKHEKTSWMLRSLLS